MIASLLAHETEGRGGLERGGLGVRSHVCND